MKQAVKEAARRLAKWNALNVDNSVALWFPAKDEVRLVFLQSDFPLSNPGEYLQLMRFPPSKTLGNTQYMEATAICRPEERGMLRLPENWGRWEDAVEIFGPGIPAAEKASHADFLSSRQARALRKGGLRSNALAVEKDARQEAEENKNWPEVQAILWFPAKDEVRLLYVETGEVEPTTAGETIPIFRFRPDPEGYHGVPLHQSSVARGVIQPGERNQAKLPEEWGAWDDAVELYNDETGTV